MDLDTSWILEEESKYYSLLDKEPMQNINCYFIYIGSDNSIQKVNKSSEKIVNLNESDNSKKGILNNRILQIIQNKKFLENGNRYKLINLMNFFIDIESKQLVEFSSISFDLSSFNLRFFKEVNIFGNIIIEPSISIFHSFNSLYFFFKEDEYLIKPIRSILKKSDKISSTKKVRIFDDIIINNNIKTKKNRI
jgi:hypothetical protein